MLVICIYLQTYKPGIKPIPVIFCQNLEKRIGIPR